MDNFGLSKEEINKKLEESGIIADSSINAEKIRNVIADVIIENNKVIETQIKEMFNSYENNHKKTSSDTVKDLEKELKRMGGIF